jgi:hypothetical protein
MRLKDLLPELTQRMTEDLYLANMDSTIEIGHVLLEYLVILNYVNDIYFLPGNSLEAKTKAVLAIKAFLQGHETPERLRHKLMAILLEYKNKKRTEKEG